MSNNKRSKAVAGYFSDSITAKGIRVPETVEEFRDNLRKYFHTRGENLILTEVVREGTSVQAGRTYEVDISTLTRMGDLYPEKWGGEVWLMPLAEQVKDTTDYMMETMQAVSCWGYFKDPDNFRLYDSVPEMNNPCWVKLDNQIWREYFALTLGDFSGYRFGGEEVTA